LRGYYAGDAECEIVTLHKRLQAAALRNQSEELRIAYAASAARAAAGRGQNQQSRRMA